MYQRTLCVALTLAALVTADICSLCDCSPSTDPPGGLAVNCSARGISSTLQLNLDTHASIVSLNLSRNALQYLAPFPGNGSSLRTLDVSDNSLLSIDPTTLKPLVLLETLRLSNNPLSDGLNNDMLASSLHLQALYIDNTQLVVLPPRLLAHTPSLRVFDASRTVLQHPVARGFFNNTSQLELINLDSNEVTAAQGSLNGFFDGLTSLRVLQWTGLYVPTLSSADTASLVLLEQLQLGIALDTSIDPDSFNPMRHSLRSLSLSFRYRPSSPVPPFPVSALEPLTLLQSLNLEVPTLTIDSESGVFGCYNHALESLTLVFNLVPVPMDTFFSSNLSAVRSLSLSSSGFLPPFSFSNLTALETLSLTTSEYATFDIIFIDNSFANLVNLTTINAIEVPIGASLTNATFASTPRLQHVNFNSANIPSVPANLFRFTPLLTTLHLQFNDFATLPATLLAHTPLLTYLDLSLGPLTSLPSSFFRSTPNLSFLTLSSSSIVSLPSDLFAGLSRLTHLDLSFCIYLSPPVGLFTPLSGLSTLNLENTNTSDVFLHSLPFATLANLTLLNLESCPFQLLGPSSLFEGVGTTGTGLASLLVTGGRITTLAPFVFLPIASQLVELDLSTQLISSLDVLTFTGLSRLKSLNLQHNKLTSLSEGLFAGLIALESLQLDFNNISSLPPLFGSSCALAFPLAFFSMSFNSISSIDPLLFVPCPFLSHLILRHNALSSVNFLGITPLSHLSAVDLSFNQLTIDSFREWSVITGQPLTVLDISENQLTALPYICGYANIVSFFGNPFTGPMCPSGTYGMFPICILCASKCFNNFGTGAGGLLSSTAGCSGPGPTECCPAGLSGPGCAYVTSCLAHPCAKYNGTCIDSANVTQAAICHCPPPTLSYFDEYGPNCVPECVQGTFPSYDSHVGEVCLACDVQCLHGCTSAGLAGCIVPPDRTPVEVGGGVAAAAVLVALVAAVLVRRRVRRAQQHQSALYTRLLDDRDQQVRFLEQLWSISERDLTLTDRIGQGAFGTVWRALWLGRQVAVKMLNSAVLETDEQSGVEFAKEVNFLRGLRHENIVLFYGAGVQKEDRAGGGGGEGGAPFLVLEYMERGSLRAVLDDPTVDVPYALVARFALDIARGMRFLHSRSYLHRDLKGENVLVDSKWTCKIADLGSSKLASATAQAQQPHQTGTMEEHELSALAGPGDEFASSRTSHAIGHAGVTTMGVGSLLWSAPEVIRGNEFVMASDVYSYAIVLYEIVSRTLPFAEVALSDVASSVVRGYRPSLASFSAAPPALRALIVSAWDPMPAHRPSFTDIVHTIAELD